MTTTYLSRLGAISGAVFAVVLFLSSGDGSHGYSAPRAILGVVAITLAMPFIVYLGQVLRDGGGSTRWLADVAVFGGVSGIVLKLGSAVPALAVHRAGIDHGTTMYTVLNQLGGAATVLSLDPLAVLCAGTAIVALRTRCLPAWLGVFASLTAVALLVNGAFLGADFLPALLVFLLWTLVTSVHLTRVAGRDPVAAAPSTVVA